MAGIILASHGNFAPGILQSVEMLFGKQKNMQAISLLPEDSLEDFKVKLNTAIASFKDSESIVFFTDIKGGTPYNQTLELVKAHEETWAVVTGMNLPMLITAAVTAMGSDKAQEIAASVLKDAKGGIQIYPQSLEK